MAKRLRTWKHPRPRDVFEFLDLVRQRPEMYLGDSTNLRALEEILRGYEIAVDVHAVEEGRPGFGLPFLFWVRFRRGWSMSCGWASAIRSNLRPGEAPLDVFFALVDEYRKLRPRVVAGARLGPKNKPTGAVGSDGLGRVRPAPREIYVIQYAPAPLFLLRYRYATFTTEQVMSNDGSEATSAAFAKAHAQREFGIAATAWKRGKAATSRAPRPRRPTARAAARR